ncbi:MAG: phage baseplate assembly protein [Acidobacteria bacterium]|nr:phage baseplate assembly protein [Acidobacteriota bacterium]
MQIAYPLRIDQNRRTGTTDEETHVRDLIEQLLFTAPGERVMRPTFGSGVMQLVFAPNSIELAATTQFLVEGALQQWLGDLIELHGVVITAEDATLRVEISYVIRATQQARTDTFQRSAG